MKPTISGKKLREMFPGYRFLAIGYCAAHYLLRGAEPMFSNYGIYGHNWDAYVFPHDKVIVVTGMRNLKTEHPNYKLLDDYEQKALVLATQSYKVDYDDYLGELEKLRHEFFQAALSK